MSARVDIPAGSEKPGTAFDSEFAISEWQDTDEVMARLNALLAQPVCTIRRENMDKVLKWFEDNCSKSRAMAEQAAEVIPGGIQHNLAFNYPHPLAITEANGAYMSDVDGNRYIDFLQAGGPTLLGSNYEPVRRKIKELLDSCGPTTGLLHEYEVKLAELVCRHMPAIDMLRMLGSGTEGVMAAIRVARAHTGKKWIIKMGGGYHGWSDQMVYGMRVPGTGRRDAVGIPRSNTSKIHESFPHDLAALRRKLKLNRLSGGTAAVIVEPLGPESGTRPIHRSFNAELRKLCDEFGALLIFDEVVTGFRLGLSGAQGYFNVQPDLTVLGKCITGGYPMAGALGDFVILVLDCSTRQVQEIVTERLIKQFVRHPPVGRHRPVVIGDVEHRKSSSLAFSFLASHRSVSAYGWVRVRSLECRRRCRSFQRSVTSRG